MGGLLILLSSNQNIKYHLIHNIGQFIFNISIKIELITVIHLIYLIII